MSESRITNTVLVLVLGCTVFAVVGFVLGGHELAGWLSTRFSRQLEGFSGGFFRDPTAFVYNRLREIVILGSVIGGMIMLDLAWFRRFTRWARRASWGWMPATLVLFIQLNFVAWTASQTTVFWMALWSGEGESHPITAFQIKHQLMAEVDASERVVLLGNSQVSAQVEEVQLVDALGDSTWVVEFGYMGAEPFDFLLMQRELGDLKPDAVVVYLSELSFYRGVRGMRYPPFMDSRGQQDFVSLGGSQLSDSGLDASRWFARVASAIPLFHLREPIARRVVGQQAADIEQLFYNVDLIPDLGERAVASASLFTSYDSPAVLFHKRALELFVQRADRQGARVVLLAGMVNPRLSRRLDPSIRADMLDYLRRLASEYPHVALIDEDAMPDSQESEFQDLSHVTEAEKQTGTEEVLPALVEGLRADRQ